MALNPPAGQWHRETLVGPGVIIRSHLRQTCCRFVSKRMLTDPASEAHTVATLTV